MAIFRNWRGVNGQRANIVARRSFPYRVVAAARSKTASARVAAWPAVI
jgi:hypothetical protein